MPREPADRRALLVLALLLTAGWGANHFAAVLPVLRDEEGLSPGLLAGVYGLYAVGLLPGLLAGGGLSDRVGRARVALPGAALAILGSLLLAVWHDPAGLAVGRVVVGLGSGAAFSAGTAWSTDLGGAPGAVRAGVALTAGFAVGPVVSGLLASALPAPLLLPFLLSALLSLAAVLAATASLRGAAARERAGGADASRRDAGAPPAAGSPDGPGAPVAEAAAEALAEAQAETTEHPPRDADDGGVGRALGWALPIAPWVFTSTVAIVVVPQRTALPAIDAPIVAGLAAGLMLGTGILAQAVGRRRELGPASGAAGAASTGLALLLLAVAGASPAALLALVIVLLFGLGYGLCLRQGLLDLQEHAPPARRGLATGIFYVATYSGFAAPFALEALSGPAGLVAPPAVLGAIALVAGAQRALRLRRAPG